MRVKLQLRSSIPVWWNLAVDLLLRLHDWKVSIIEYSIHWGFIWNLQHRPAKVSKTRTNLCPWFSIRLSQSYATTFLVMSWCIMKYNEIYPSFFSGGAHLCTKSILHNICNIWLHIIDHLYILLHSWRSSNEIRIWSRLKLRECGQCEYFLARFTHTDQNLVSASVWLYACMWDTDGSLCFWWLLFPV